MYPENPAIHRLAWKYIGPCDDLLEPSGQSKDLSHRYDDFRSQFEVLEHLAHSDGKI